MRTQGFGTLVSIKDQSNTIDTAYHDRITWLFDNVGQRHVAWVHYFEQLASGFVNEHYEFKDADKAVLFKLRWGGQCTA